MELHFEYRYDRLRLVFTFVFDIIMEEYSFRVNFEFICLNFAEFLGGCILVTRLKVVCMLKRCILHT